jgi:hypothetical protein
MVRPAGSSYSDQETLEKLLPASGWQRILKPILGYGLESENALS